jgi:hypothetical protein
MQSGAARGGVNRDDVAQLFFHHTRAADMIVQGALLAVKSGHNVTDRQNQAA